MHSRDVAQLGSALPWGGRGREFKSHRSDQFFKLLSFPREFFILIIP
jgi:hypothetical protein